ncbi:MAG: FAD-binding oxidoreductase, partial [Coleofasciculus sp. S288]|nr:FAD-binding oxidoreductase [Coleofasciculus sp. S288]
MSPHHKPVVILGAGLQGSCIALELAQKGIKVILLDQDEIPMNRASLRNEGKVHLGLVYANDRTLATATLVLQGALHFHYLLAKWLGSAIERLSCSTPFNYLVANDSLLADDELANHYCAIESEYHQYLAQHPQLNYLGKQPEQLYRPLTPKELAIHFQMSCFQAGFQTAEVSVDTDQLAILIRQAIDRSPNIEFLPSRRVKAVER